MQKSIVEQFNSDGCSSCGYCKQSFSSRSNGMLAHKLSVDDYQALIDRGWRRSGIYCYKPIMDETCCPAYTIMCDAVNFKLSKSQKKILNKFNRCLNDNHESNNAKSSKRETSSVSSQNEGNTHESSSTNIKDDKLVKKGDGPDPNKAPSKKAKLIRLEKKLAKGKSKVDEMEVKISQVQEKSLEDFLIDIPKDKLKIKLVRTAPPSNEWKATENISHILYQKYQTTIHGDTPQKCSKNQFKRFLVDSPLKIKLVAIESKEFYDSFDKSAKVYQKYQMVIHKEKAIEHDSEVFKDFLVTSPLKAETRDSVGFGSFHQQYWYNDELIAVGVIDILPKCVSSVYFFYDPLYNYLSLGTYGALREIEFTRKLHRQYADIKSYYMGFYIHSCPKMRYKGNYSPSYLLCPETYSWFPIEDCIEKLNENPYSRLNPDIDAKDENYVEEDDVNQLLVLNARKNTCFNYGHLRSRRILCDDLEEDNMTKYGKLIGKKCSQNMVLVVMF